MHPDWLELDARHVWHPYTQHGLAPPPRPVLSGDGAYLTLAGGERLFDAISSWWVTLHGHAQPSIARAVAEQARVLEQVIFAGFSHEPAARLAGELVQRLPAGLTRIFYSDDGSTAVEVAVKLALQHAQLRGERRPLLAALENAYHGDTFGAMSASARGVFTDAFAAQLFEVARLPDPSSGDTVAALERLLETRGDELAAVIVEPLLLAAGGMRVYGEQVLRDIRRLTREAGVLLIADEVATGFGRTGPLFACQRAGVEPDLMCLSKGLTGGFMPMGVTAAREELFESFLSSDRRRTFFHGHSFTGNPLACAAARASLRQLDAECAVRRGAIEGAHHAALERLGTHPGVAEPRVLGTVAALELRAGDGYLSPVGRELERFAAAQGMLIRPLGNTVYLLPPFCATPAEVGDAWAVVERFLETQ
jgi:adenosylmethionine-8-amino-7-oxononanoate aminotransferase